MMTEQGVLEGIKVLDFTQMLAGPTATRVMAIMGAEVIKVELTPSGDLSRTIPVIKDGRSAYFMQHNRGKKSICLDLRDPRGLDIIKSIIPQVDVFIESFSPGVIARRGLDWDTVHQLNPRLVMCSISAFGQTGPQAKSRGFDFIAQAYAGLTSLNGEADGPPGMFSVGMGDVGTGMNALAAINGALFAAHRKGGSGRFVDIALLDTYFNMNDTAVQMYSASGGQLVPKRAGSHHFSLAPVGIFAGPGGYLVIMALTPDQWVGICKAMEQPDLATDPRFLDHGLRTANIDVLVEIIETWLSSLPGIQAAIDTLESHGIPSAPVLSIPEAMEHPQVRHRGLLQTMDDPLVGQVQVPGLPFRISGGSDDQPLTAPTLGEHNAEILSTYLGMTPEQISQLEADGVLAAAPT